NVPRVRGAGRAVRRYRPEGRLGLRFRRTHRVLTTATTRSPPSTQLLRVPRARGARRPGRVVHAGHCLAPWGWVSSDASGCISMPLAPAAGPQGGAARPAPLAPGRRPPARPAAARPRVSPRLPAGRVPPLRAPPAPRAAGPSGAGPAPAAAMRGTTRAGYA